jgi:hypothetical protein
MNPPQADKPGKQITEICLLGFLQIQQAHTIGQKCPTLQLQSGHFLDNED